MRRMPELGRDTCLSHYRLLERIGQGGMGEVWLAEDTMLPRRVAIKVLAAGMASDHAAVDRLLREARVAASIDHPHIVTVHEAGIHQGRPFLVMQYLEGETLEQRLLRGPLPISEAVELARAIADALAEVHALEIVHRDLKPANVVLTARGPRILDFGISAMRGGPRLTATGEAIGTPLATSPEQYAGRSADQRSDLWALGVILYEALTGTSPFEGDNLAVVAYRVMNQEPEPASIRNPAVTPKLDRVIARLLEKEPARRHARAEDVLADLVGADASGVSVPAPTPPTPRVAVLYFEVLSPEPDDQFLAAGLTEDLIVDLARVPGLRVSARGEVLPYREQSRPPRTVARELGVEFVVQGSVRRAGARGRISAQLVRASDGHAVWAERFDRTLDDLFEVQAEVSKRIVEALEIRLGPTEREMLDRAPTRNREAYAFYLRGRAHGIELRRDASRRAEQCYRHALALDPEFAHAHSALAECLMRRALAWWAEPAEIEDARAHARRALELDPDLPEAHVALGMVHRVNGNAAGFLEEVRAAHLNDSNHPEIMLWTGRSYMALGRPDDAMRVLERLLRLRPGDYRILSAYADCSDVLGRKDAVASAVERLREVLPEVLERTPDDTYARSMFSIALAQAGEIPHGIVQAERALADGRDDGRVLYNAACTFTYAGHHDRAMELLRDLVRFNPGFPRDWVRRDRDLSPLHARPDFIELFGEST
jgi:TolB-like protein/cytochrome c-type biogenesis protein CcmH/NrfG